jgi:hypothetical protein
MPAALTFDLTWESHPDLLEEAVGVYSAAFWANLSELFDYWKDELKAYAKENHPWKNRTGDAERELDAEVEEVMDGFILSLFHGVPYGVYLEMGEYAIINPTMEAHYAAFMHDVRDLVEG